MEHWQVSHIQKNKYDLLWLTECQSLFRAVLQQHGVLGASDISQLDAVHHSKGKYCETELLYSLLLTRKGGRTQPSYATACTRTRQTGALYILNQARADGTIVCFQPQHIKNTTIWDELSEDLKIEMGNKLVDFQGTKVKVSECCNHLDHLIDGKFLSELVKGNIPALVKNQVPDPVEYYIQRTLRSRSKLKSSVFQQACNDVFVFEGMEKYQLTSLVAGADTDVSGNQIECLTVHYILLEYEGDFEKICKLTRLPVHLIKYKNDIFEWVQSSGSLENLQKYVDDDQDCFSEVELASRGNRVNVISDSPGMGKTVLLANVAHQISKEKPNMLIRFMVMSEFVQALSKRETNLESIISLIAEQSSEFECGKQIVKHILTSEPCILMLDGFDEVLLNQVKTAKKILQTITTLKSAQIFVTTRPHMRDELENTLYVLGTTMNPFTISDQVNFLIKFWQLRDAHVNENLKQFAASCVNAISSNMSDFERDIAGIPLQCRLLAETYTDQAIRCSSNKILQPVGQINSIFEMYERHMKMRLETWKTQVEAIKNVHTYYALELLFREQAYQFADLKSTFCLNDLCTLGFLEATNSENIRFVHRTFAEYFVAWFAMEMKIPEKVISFLLNELLETKSRKEFLITPFGKADLGTSHTFNYPVITYFINGFTKMQAESHGYQNQNHRVSMLIDSVYYGQVSRILIASAVRDYEFVPVVVSLCFDLLELDDKGDSDICPLILFSAKYSCVALMKTFVFERDLTNLKTLPKFDSFLITPLHVAVQRGYYYLMEFLSRKYESWLNNLQYLLHFCVFESLTENDEIIKDKVQIIKLLSIKNNAWIDEKAANGAVPLLQKNVNCELIKCLIECGADVNLLDKKGNTILHTITENPVTPEFYHWLVVSLSKRKFKHFNHPNSNKVSPLHCAVMKVELLADTLKYFKLNSADFNAEDETEESPLFYAIRGGRSVSLIHALTELGADYKKKNKYSETVLHICAKHGKYEAMKYFVETLKMGVNPWSVRQGTPLHLAALKRSVDYVSMQQLLIIGGAWVYNKTFGFRNTPFKKALVEGNGLNLSIIKLMDEHGLPITPKEASEALTDLLSNRNIMSKEIDKELAQVLWFLIGKGGQIEDNIWESKGMQKNMRAIIQATDMSCLWDHIKLSGILTESELKEIQNLSTDPFNKCERFYKIIQTKKGSFERVCILLINSNQLSSLSLIRQSLYSVLPSNRYMFMTPPTFTNHFIHSQQNSSFNKMALVTTNPYLAIQRIRDTIRESIVEIKESDISPYLQKMVHEDLIVVKVRVVTVELINRLEAIGETQCKIIFVCSALTENVENCHIVTDTLSTWDAISTQYLVRNRMYFVLNYMCPISKVFKSPLILSKLSYLPWISERAQLSYSVKRFKAGHISMEFQSKNYLCLTIFQYFLPDKVVFQGISIDKLQGFSRFGHKIGYFDDDDVEYFDFLVIEQSHQFDEICKQTSENVHLVEYEQERGVFKRVRTWGWDENIQWFFKQPLCQGFPYCDCAPGNENLVVRLNLKTRISSSIVRRFECMLPINELTPATLKFMELDDAEELFSMAALLKRVCGQLQVEQTVFGNKSHSEIIVKFITKQLTKVLVENELNYVAINTLFPELTEQPKIIKGLEKYHQLGMLRETGNNRVVFVHQSLAWFIIAKLLMGQTENPEFEEVAAALRNQVFQNGFETEDLKLADGYFEQSLRVSGNSPENQLSSYKFVDVMCFRFIDALLEESLGENNSNISNFLKNKIAAEPEEEIKWIQSCVNANLFHLLQLIISFKIDAPSSAIGSEELVVVAVNYADIPIIRLVSEHFEKKTKTKLTEIKVYLDSDEISMVALATFRGNNSVVRFLLNDHGFRCQLQDHDKLVQVGQYCVSNTTNNSGFDINSRKCIIDLLFRTDMSLLEQVLLSSRRMHLDLIVYLINLGVNIHATKDDNHILHLCSNHLTPEEYHEVVKLIHAKDNTNIYRLFQDYGSCGETAFHVALKYLELLDETLAHFSEVGINFNTLTEDGDSLFVHAAKHFRSARLLDTLYRLGADIHARDENGHPASVYCCNNKAALRYLSSRGVDT